MTARRIHRLQSFAPVARTDARLLILGSMPGVESLRRQQYYAHPRNAFWFIMGELFGAAPELAYAERLQRLTDEGVALWDVLKHCQRAGSLDSNIKEAVANDFDGFFAAHPGIEKICFNGRKAFELFRTRVLRHDRRLQRRFDDKRLIRLPSTSPAMASLSREQKAVVWAKHLDLSYMESSENRT